MRPLSSVGRAATERLAAAAAKRGVKPDVIWHSGKLRARQTAELFWKACNPFAPLTAERGLLPDDPPQWMRDRLTGETRSILIAGHMPYLPRLLALLVGAHGESRASVPAARVRRARRGRRTVDGTVENGDAERRSNRSDVRIRKNPNDPNDPNDSNDLPAERETRRCRARNRSCRSPA